MTLVIDAHTHLDHSDEADYLVNDAVEAGVRGMVSIGCGAASIRATLEIARRNRDYVRVAAGVHPQGAAAFDMSTFPEIAELCSDELVVAIGETGFDLYRDHGTLAQQQPAFDAQAELAVATGRPLVIHTRAAEQHTLDALARWGSALQVVMHCFSLADEPYLSEVIERGYWCSFAGNVTYPSAQNLRDALERIPAERVMVETDAPYLAPVPMRGKRNVPAHVTHTRDVVAQVLGMSADRADRMLGDNARRAFGLPDSWAEPAT